MCNYLTTLHKINTSFNIDLDKKLEKLPIFKHQITGHWVWVILVLSINM